MKKIVLMLLVAFCAASFSQAAENGADCSKECLFKFIECIKTKDINRCKAIRKICDNRCEIQSQN